MKQARRQCPGVPGTTGRLLGRVLSEIPRSASRRPAPGSGRVWGGGARGARRLRQPHHLHSAGRRPAPGSSRVWGGGRGAQAPAVAPARRRNNLHVALAPRRCPRPPFRLRPAVRIAHRRRRRPQHTGGAIAARGRGAGPFALGPVGRGSPRPMVRLRHTRGRTRKRRLSESTAHVRTTAPLPPPVVLVAAANAAAAAAAGAGAGKRSCHRFWQRGEAPREQGRHGWQSAPAGRR